MPAGTCYGEAAMRMPAKFAPLRSRLIEAWERRALSLKAASFAVIGVLNTLIDLGVFLTAYNIFSLPLVPANVIAWMVAVSGSYVMNCFITFAAESGGRLRWRAYGAFVLSGVVGVIANTTTLVVASYWIPVLAAKLVAIAASFLVNFSLSHFVVFRTRERPPEPSGE
jgi:putative flippase GtrA